MTIDLTKVEVRTHPQGYVLWKIPRDLLESFGITPKHRDYAQFGSGSREFVTLYAHKLLVCEKLGKVPDEESIIRFRDQDKTNLAFDNLRVFVVKEIDGLE